MRPRVGCRAALRTVRFRAHLIQYVTTISDAAGWFGDPLDGSVGITSAIALGRTLAGGALRKPGLRLNRRYVHVGVWVNDRRDDAPHTDAHPPT